MNSKNAHGITFDFLENGSLRSIEADPIRISLKATTPYSGSGANLYLRKRTQKIEYAALLGPESNSSFEFKENAFVAIGSWAGIDYVCILQLSEISFCWQWVIEMENTSSEPVDLDMVHMQDVGLKPVNAGLINEYYVAQYLERRILEDETYGSVLCCRQNMRESTGHPWFMLACKNGALSAATDGMQFYGKTFRETVIPEGLLAEKLSGEYAGESSIITLQEKPFNLKPGETYQSIFFGKYLPDHPKATSDEDLELLPQIEKDLLSSIKNSKLKIKNFESHRPIAQSPNRQIAKSSNRQIAKSLPLLPEDLSENELIAFFGSERRHAETGNGRLLSFFSRDHRHVVLRAKEVMADRPHAHIMQAKSGFAPDESIMSTTSFMFGVFNSHITQGNTNFNVLLSICTSQFNQSPESGQRIIVEIDGQPYLLGVPSAFEMGLNHCRWIYKHGDHIFQVRTWTSKLVPQVNMDFKVIKGRAVKLYITHDFDPLNEWTVYMGPTSRDFIALPETGSMISQKFEHARFRFLIQADNDFRDFYDEGNLTFREPHAGGLFILETVKTTAICMSFIGEVCGKVEAISISDADRQFYSDCRVALTEWEDLSLGLELKSEQEDIAAIREILPWYGMNALTHFLTPYGLEQFGGAAWGTRDVSQGPVDLLLTMEKYDEARQVLCTIFSNQNPDGGWPQWWMFDSYREIRAGDSHGDVFYWCIIALATYIKVTGDLEILDEALPYYHEKGPSGAERTPLSEHIDRLISMITGSFIPGTALVPFGGGDWNDSLQPVSQELAQRMISSWTVEMNYQAYRQYVAVYEMTGELEKAMRLENICDRIRDDFNRYLVKDGVVAGYGRVEDNGEIHLMLHPSDDETGVHYSILPMERGIISGIFTREQALHNQDLIEKYLKGPDGARLMDRPLQYKGGIQTIFQRAESSTFFGREIGLMYVHEHIRYAESLALMGKADAFVKALRQAIPVGYREVVPCGDIRQANCYYSSSDVIFKNRYEADERYDEVKTGKYKLRGGWRVYSSGPGIYLSLVVTRLLGLRIDSGNVIVDPVMPFSFDGLSVSMDFMDYPVTFRYSVKEANFSPKTLIINGREIRPPSVENKFRQGGAVIRVEDFLALMKPGVNIVEVSL